MFICKDCGAIFEDCKIIKDPRPYGMGVCYEEIGLCPNCNSDDYSEAKVCSKCGEVITNDDYDFSDDFEYLCRECYEETHNEQTE